MPRGPPRVFTNRSHPMIFIACKWPCYFPWTSYKVANHFVSILQPTDLVELLLSAGAHYPHFAFATQALGTTTTAAYQDSLACAHTLGLPQNGPSICSHLCRAWHFMCKILITLSSIFLDFQTHYTIYLQFLTRTPFHIHYSFPLCYCHTFTQGGKRTKGAHTSCTSVMNSNKTGVLLACFGNLNMKKASGARAHFVMSSQGCSQTDSPVEKLK